MARRFFIPFLVLLLAPAAFAQIEMTAASGGMVGVGVSPTNDTQLYVRNSTSTGLSGYGIRGYVLDGTTARFGVYGRATGGNSPYGMYAYGTGGSTSSRGLYAYSSSSGQGTSAYAIYANVAGTGTKYAGYFVGNLHSTGTVTWVSDSRFKEDVRPMGEEESDGSTISDRLMQLEPVAYRFTNDAQYAHMNLPEGEQFGFIAQDVERIFPELISGGHHPTEMRPDENGDLHEVGEAITYKAMNYVHLIPILVQTVQEQQAEIDELRTLVQQLIGEGN